MTGLPESLRDVDWSLTTWEGSRREQLRRWAALPLSAITASLEEMAEIHERLRSAENAYGTEEEPGREKQTGKR